MVPLWEYENEDGRIRFTRRVENPLPVEVYLSLVGKYRHLGGEQISHIQERVNKQIENLESFARERLEVSASEEAVTLSETRRAFLWTYD